MSSVDQLLAEYDASVQELAEALRQLVAGTLPGIQEAADLPARLIAYSYGPGYKHTICTLILSKKGIKLGFYKGSELPDPAHLLTGTGKVHKYVQVSATKDAQAPALRELLKEALKMYHARTS